RKKSILGWQSKKFKIKARKIPRNAAYLAVREIPRDGSATQILDFLRSHQSYFLQKWCASAINRFLRSRQKYGVNIAAINRENIHI
ncbi:MAG: hypothetical protein KGY61_09500, partial [Desulfobacterales bacterium]|nr:hypothetical protein [Desulfobacterales bacterium]